MQTPNQLGHLGDYGRKYNDDLKYYLSKPLEEIQLQEQHEEGIFR